MKKARKAISLALALLLAAALLTGCGGNEEEALIGSWTKDYDISQDILSGMDPSLAQYYDFSGTPAHLALDLELSADGTYTMGVKQENLEKLLENIRPVIRDGTLAYAESILAATGLDMSAEEVFQQSGSSLDELVEEILAEAKNSLSEMGDELSVSGKWKAKDGKLYTTESMDEELDESSYELYELNGDTLTVYDNTGEGEDLVFTRVA